MDNDHNEAVYNCHVDARNIAHFWFMYLYSKFSSIIHILILPKQTKKKLLLKLVLKDMALKLNDTMNVMVQKRQKLLQALPERTRI